MKEYNIAIVGATGLVGRTFIKILEEQKIKVKVLKLYASFRSVGKKIKFNQEDLLVEDLKLATFDNIDFCLFSAGSNISKIYAPIAASKGAYVIDNSSYFRMDNNVALVVPEINFDDIYQNGKIIANPNCSTIQSVIPLKALDDKFDLIRVRYTTYQSVSGSGQKGIDDLLLTKNGGTEQFYPYNISQTCIPHIDSFLDDGYTLEEQKMVNETNKILHKQIYSSATCVRVPVLNSHGVLIQAEFKNKLDIKAAKEALELFPAIKVVDDFKNLLYPVSTIATGNDYVYVGRIRKDKACENGILLYSVSDNIRRGAATNAVLILKKLIEEKKC